ncbi:hypothetical protein SERLA73DRAFT_25875, partial [Serpula lacrymans var. lacrymans S7.3]
WVDNCVIAGDNFDDKLSTLEKFMQRYRDEKLSLNPGKTLLFMTEAKYAEAIISKDGIQPDRTKIETILDWPKPKTAHNVLGFLGL